MARQITEAFPWNETPRYMNRDPDRIDGALVPRRLRAMGIRDKPIAPASPWQNGFAERLIASIRRECLNHVIVLGEAHLRRIQNRGGIFDFFDSIAPMQTSSSIHFCPASLAWNAVRKPATRQTASAIPRSQESFQTS
jgi:hypothetical protein